MLVVVVVVVACIGWCNSNVKLSPKPSHKSGQSCAHLPSPHKALHACMHKLGVVVVPGVDAEARLVVDIVVDTGDAVIGVVDGDIVVVAVDGSAIDP